MKKLFPFILSLFFLQYTFFLASCCGKKNAAAQNTTIPEVKRDFEKEGFIKATVVYYELDGCKYILQLVSDPNGPDVIYQLEPQNLKEEFQKDQLAVWIKYTARKGGVSVCMAGQMVDLTDIQLRK